jgi:hypothetical protein
MENATLWNNESFEEMFNDISSMLEARPEARRLSHA